MADWAAFLTKVSKDGQVVTTATYYLKNRGQAHFKVSLENVVDLWGNQGGRQAGDPDHAGG